MCGGLVVNTFKEPEQTPFPDTQFLVQALAPCGQNMSMSPLHAPLPVHVTVHVVAPVQSMERSPLHAELELHSIEQLSPGVHVTSAHWRTIVSQFMLHMPGLYVYAATAGSRQSQSGVAIASIGEGAACRTGAPAALRSADVADGKVRRPHGSSFPYS